VGERLLGRSKTMTLEQLEERLMTLEKVVEQLQTRVNVQSNPDSPSGEQREGAEDDLIPGAEYDLVITVPPEETIYFQGKIVSVEEPPAELGLSDEDWANYASEDEDE
jgi:hypothetical protein